MSDVAREIIHTRQCMRMMRPSNVIMHRFYYIPSSLSFCHVLNMR